MNDAGRIVAKLRSIGTTMAVVRAEYRCSYATLYRAIFSRLSKEQWRAISCQKIARGGIRNHFKKGHATWNQGRKGTHFSPATEFKKGHIPGKYKPIGTIYIIKDGGKPYRWIKLSDEGRRQDRRTPYARYVWEKEHGPIPPGMCVIHHDGDTLNDESGNLILADRAGKAMHQLTTNPGHLRKFRREARKALINRWVNHRKAQLRGAVMIWYQCTGCGQDYPATPTPPCEKCGHLIFERIEQPIAFARRRATVEAEANGQQITELRGHVAKRWRKVEAEP